MKTYNLESNEWLQNLYEIRKSWVPVYSRETFFASMNTTGRSEGVNSFMDAFVNSRTTLNEFVVKYDQASKRIVKREDDEDYETEHKNRIVKHNEHLLKHAAKVYTRNIFIKFKCEFNAMFDYRVVETKVDSNGFESFVIRSDINEFENFTVKLDLKTHKGACQCKMFEFVGILCRHILKVLFRYDVYTIPNHFILQQWMQKANKFRNIDCDGLPHNDGFHSEALRLSHMCQESTKLACLAAPSSECHRIYIETMNDLYKKISEIRLHEKMGENSSENSDAKSCEKTGEKSETEPSQLLLLDPNISQTKGRKKDNSKHSERFKGGLEAALSKKKRHCKCCNKFVYHDTRTCPENPRSKFYKGTQMVEGDLKSGQEEESEHEEENGQEEESEQETDYSENNN